MQKAVLKIREIGIPPEGFTDNEGFPSGKKELQNNTKLL